MNLSTSPVAVSVLVGADLIVVGEIVGSGEAQERGVVGETPNLAAPAGDRRTEYGRDR